MNEQMGSLLAVAFVAFVTLHISLVVGLARRGRRVRSLAALFVPPLALFWGYEAGMRRRALAWSAALLAYAVVAYLARLAIT
jgi:hypothetical protein